MDKASAARVYRLAARRDRRGHQGGSEEKEADVNDNPKDALLADAARLLLEAHAPMSFGDGPHIWYAAKRAWLARYEAERAGRGENDAEEIEPGVFVKRSVKSAFADIRAARTAPATPGKDGGE